MVQEDKGDDPEESYYLKVALACKKNMAVSLRETLQSIWCNY